MTKRAGINPAPTKWKLISNFGEKSLNWKHTSIFCDLARKIHHFHSTSNDQISYALKC